MGLQLMGFVDCCVIPESLTNMEPGAWVIWGLLAMATFLVAAHGHSLEVAFNPEQPLSRMQLHRQLTAMNSAVTISASPDVLGANVSLLTGCFECN